MIRPILFNTEMTERILGYGKLNTRRIVKPQSKKNIGCKLGYCVAGDKKDIGKFGSASHECGGGILCVKPPALVGDILYVRETWGISNLDYNAKVAYIVYKASGDGNEGCRPVRFPDNKFEKLYGSMVENSPVWYPSIHMPKEAARIWLKVMDVRVEQLQDMALDDFLNEGIQIPYEAFNDPINAYMQAKRRFAALWDSTMNKERRGLYGWDANPWVWVIGFQRCERPER